MNIVKRRAKKATRKFMTIRQLAELLDLSENDIYRKLGDEEEMTEDSRDNEKKQT
jgi:hypothetical protein